MYTLIEEGLFLIPGTSIKGALSHRTAFHFNALNKKFSDKEEDLLALCGESNEAVEDLFGSAKREEKGRRGKVLIDDLLLTPQGQKDQLVHHVGMDRFTGGARDGVLFNERPLWGGEWTLRLFLIGADSLEKPVKRAFILALKDLAEGRLQVGAGAGRGEGFLTGRITWPKGWEDES